MIRSLLRRTRRSRKTQRLKLMKQLKKILELVRALINAQPNLIVTRSELLPPISARRQVVEVAEAAAQRTRPASTARKSRQPLLRRLRSRHALMRTKMRAQLRPTPSLSPIRCSRRTRARLRQMRMMLVSRALMLSRAKHSRCNPLPRVTQQPSPERLALSNLFSPCSRCLT